MAASQVLPGLSFPWEQAPQNELGQGQLSHGLSILLDPAVPEHNLLRACHSEHLSALAPDLRTPNRLGSGLTSHG